MKRQKWVIAGLLLVSALSNSAEATPSFEQTGNILVMSNANVTLDYNLSAGTANFYWQNSEKMSGFYSAVSNNSSYVASTSYSTRNWVIVNGTEVVVTNTGGGLPMMLQYFTLDQTDSFLTSVSLSASTNLQSNWMAPVVENTIGGVNIGITNDNRALFVPFDNDHFVSYNSESINGSDTGNEVGAFYDNTSRNGLVVGSVIHDKWKTGIHWSGSNNKLNQLNVFGGLSDYWTWDVMPHGPVVGNKISSPTIFVGFSDDWRTAMENFADENALFVPKLAWTNGVPFGWNSWGVTNYQNNITYSAAIAVSDSIRTNLQNYGFTNGGTVYVNLDSFWDNLNNFQLESLVNHCHADGQKAGVYWTPYAYWGTLSQASNSAVPNSSYMYSDILLRTTNGTAISNDGGYAIDPTHPGTKALIQYQINIFTNDGFDYVKFDFLSHGSLEGVHYDPSATTGIEAFNEGMQYLLNQINGKMFISESIAPIFPYQYGNSRRITCDAEQSEIANTEYTMNAVSCGWWISSRLYQFNDPDDLVFDNGPDTNEVQSRLINGAITGLFLNGSILTNAASVGLAQMCLTNAAINAVARVGTTFRPVDGATGTGAGDIFVRQDDSNLWDIAVFNYSSSSVNETINLSNAGLPVGNYVAIDLWSGATMSVSGSFNVFLNEKQAKLFQLAAPTVAQGQNVTWQAPAPISGDSDVSTEGSYFGSWAPNSSSSLTVNGVTFHNFSDLPDFNETGFNAGYTAFPDPGTPDNNYNTLLECGAYEYPGPACTFSWGGMSPGDIYLLELWVNGNDASRTETFTGGTNASATINYEPGHYIIGTFMAAGSGVETVTLNGDPLDNYPQVNLVQVRDVTVTASGPLITNLGTSGGNLLLGGNNGTADGAYYVLTSTNLTTPIADWTPIATNFNDASGDFGMTNTLKNNNSTQFYIIKQL